MDTGVRESVACHGHQSGGELAARHLNQHVRIVAVHEPDAFAHDKEVIGLKGRFVELIQVYEGELSGEFQLDKPLHGEMRTCFHRVSVELVLEESATPVALAAVRAAKNGYRWGWNAAWLYARKRGVTALMWHHALRVECGKTVREWQRREAAILDDHAKRLGRTHGHT